MAEIKSHEFETFLQKSARNYRIFVIYGPDRGLVSERASQLAGKSGVALDDPFSLTKLDIGDLQKDPGRLVDEVQSIGLFGGEKLIWIRGAANEKYLVDSLALLAEKPLEAAYLIVEAGDLKKGSLLRKTAEAARSVMTIPSYADDSRALNALIDMELGAEKLGITPAARQALIALIGGDRIASRNEVRKLALYCRGFDTVEEHHVTEIIGDASAISVDDAVDAILGGDLNAFLHAMQKISSSKTAIFLVLQACLKQFQLLDSMRAEMDEKRLQTPQIMQTMGRHLHFRRKPIIEQALRQWTAESIARESNRLQAAILQSRRRQLLEDSVAMQTLLSTTLQSGRKSA
ncbi:MULTISPECIES: DNA polymerase III subunit delta [Rhizobium]|uniref:DNA-directed DNA polymerase n=1 Tax=Rhizobium esperanzae TaxID=1967781 RepID=A0A7W6USY4_9HYPH|nr:MULTISPECIES: DNA polymerase III subunit delta [Rhizobium]MBB4442816.1 DNA polymerase-3 subunit delta [Rhizobium esperanzae]MDH6205575.1 DNA polymerase-3 subunit delta [Rhizobium leguminosarum]